MIIAPDHRIIVPTRRPAVPFWRNPLGRPPARRGHRPHCPLYGMAGELQIPGGEILLDSDGNRLLVCCCDGTPTVTCTQARKCSDGTLASYWVRDDVTTLPYYFIQGSTCYSVVSGNPTTSLTTGGLVLVDGPASLGSCSADVCKYIQAKRCDDGTDADLWFPPGTSLPLYFNKAGVDYFVNALCNRNATPGTLAASYTVATGCPAACCSSGTGIKAPSQVTMTISGLARCTALCGGCASEDCLGKGDGNGTFVLPLQSTSGDNCFYSDNLLPNGDEHHVRLFHSGSSIFVLCGMRLETPSTHFSGYQGCGTLPGTTLGSTSYPSGSCSGSVTGSIDTSFDRSSPSCNFSPWCAGLIGPAAVTVSW